MQYSSLRRAALVAFVTLLTFACSSDGPLVVRDSARIVAMQDELSHAGFDLTRVVVVRLKIDEQRREITSLMPVIYSDVPTPEGSAKTIFRIEQKTDTLTLFTRDPKDRLAYRVDVPVKDPAARPSLVFPVLDKSGNAIKRTISVEAVFAR